MSHPVRITLAALTLVATAGTQAPLRLFAANPVKLPLSYANGEVAIWGTGLDRPGLMVQWDGRRYLGKTFRLRYVPRNLLVLTLPAWLLLAPGTHELRLYDPASRAASNPLKLVVDRVDAALPVPFPRTSRTVLAHFWGPFGGEGAVLQEGNIYAFVRLFDLPTAKGKRIPSPRWGLPLMGFEVCSTLLVWRPDGSLVTVPGNGRPTPAGWTWEGCARWPHPDTNWWGEVYPPANLKPGSYVLEARSVRDGRVSNAVTLTVLPASAPPFLLSLSHGAVTAGYTAAHPPVRVLGYNLGRATRIYFEGPVRAAAALQVRNGEVATFLLPRGLAPGRYWVRLGDAGGPTSNRRRFDVFPVPAAAPGPVTTHVRLDPTDGFFVLGGRPDRWVLPGALTFVEPLPGRRVPFFWQENLDYIHYDGRRTDGHRLLHPLRGTIEIRGYRPADWPPGRTRPGTLFNHGYHHLLNLFPPGGDWHSKVHITVRTLYYVPDPDYWKIWSHWNGRTVRPQGNWLHLEVQLRDGWGLQRTAVVVTDPSFAAELQAPLAGKVLDIKFVYDFVDRMEGRLYVRIRGRDADYVDRTYPPSARIARPGDRLDLRPLVAGAFDFGTEKRHPNGILDPSQQAKSGAGGLIEGLVITDAAFDTPPRPRIVLEPTGGFVGPVRTFTVKVLVRGSRRLLDWRAFRLGYTFVRDGRASYHNLLYEGLWEVRKIRVGAEEGYLFTLRAREPFPAGRYVVVARGVRFLGTWSEPATADLRVSH